MTMGSVLLRPMRRAVAPFIASLAIFASQFPLIACAFGDGASNQTDPPPNQTRKEPDVHAETNFKHTNRLIDATSPYLLQHAHNPVDWHEWGQEAFALAAKEDKPIFLSIGYSACHWCHVMEHESFEDEQVAAVMNEKFVNIKVDREERPDVDEIYMHVTQVMNRGHGGWPMSVFLTPDRKPIFAGTYFPKAQFLQLLSRIDEVWTTQREDIEKQGDQLYEVVKQWANSAERDESIPDLDTVDAAATLLARHFDRSRGGFKSDGNKFPPSMTMELMLRVYRRGGDPSLLEAVEITLDNMARGGIYDHLGGGICRYSTDPEWLVPHFEKMLYDQALVSGIYIHAFQITGDRRYGDVAADIFNYVLSDLQSDEGGFYSTRDADSEGLEGAFYIWTVPQVREVLGEADAKLFCKYYDVTESGNWFESLGHAPKGPKNILRVTESPETFAKLNDLTVEALNEKLDEWRSKMLAARSERVAPGLDDKILTAWNGLMIASLAEGAAALDEPRYAKAAARAADFVLTQMRRDGRLLRTYRGGTARLTGYLSDYAFMIDGLLNLYEATSDPRWLKESVSLSDVLIEHYFDETGGGFFFTADDAEELIARTKNPRDGAIPSGNSVAAEDFIRLARLLDRDDYREKSRSIFQAFGTSMMRNPSSFDRLLCALDAYHDKAVEIAIVGDPAAETTQALLAEVFSRYLPNKILAVSDSAQPSDYWIALLRGKSAQNGAATAYVCENYACKKPVTEAKPLAELLGKKE